MSKCNDCGHEQANSACESCGSESLGHFNGLTPAEAERLAVLIEEMGEAAQIACKVLRHGYESHDPENPRYIETNRYLLGKELGHVLHALNRMFAAKDLNSGAVQASADAKAKTIERWLHHQPAP